MVSRLSRHDALRRLRDCLENGIVEPQPHFLRALRDDGLDFGDAMVVLKTGNIYKEPEFETEEAQDRLFGVWPPIALGPQSVSVC